MPTKSETQLVQMLRTIIQALNHVAEVVPAAGPIRRLTDQVTATLDEIDPPPKPEPTPTPPPPPPPEPPPASRSTSRA